MAVLSDADRIAVWAECMSESSAIREDVNLTKSQLRVAINAVDDWVDANASSFNQALPLPARTNLTASQKAKLLRVVVRRRFEVA